MRPAVDGLLVEELEEDRSAGNEGVLGCEESVREGQLCDFEGNDKGNRWLTMMPTMMIVGRVMAAAGRPYLAMSEP
jgi:hypothetical protein